MDPVLKAALSSWDWRLDVILILLTAGMLFLRGWIRLRRRSQRTDWYGLGAAWRPFSYGLGLILVGLALMSPLDTLASVLFSIHMVQHLLLIMLAPPLLLAANPMPFILWGLPDLARRPVGRGLSRLLNPNASFRRQLRAAIYA